MRQPLRWAALAGLTLCLASGARSTATGQKAKLSPISNAEFARLTREIKPKRGQSTWREVSWLTDVTEARRRAAREGKPILVFMAADGSPLGRT
jgi:hypothetical protein